MLLNWCCSLNIFDVEKSVCGDVKKSITSLFFNRITFHLAVRCRTFQKVNVESLKLKFETVAEKTAKNVRGLLYFAAPGMSVPVYMSVYVKGKGVYSSLWIGNPLQSCGASPAVCDHTVLPATQYR